MPESSAGTYARLAGVEFVNNTRVLSYLRNGLGPSSLNISGDCFETGDCGNCPSVLEHLGCEEDTYLSPSADNAPWYSASVPDSAGFLGFYVDKFDGLGSPFEREVAQTIRHGGILSRSRLGTREMTWRGYLFGATCPAVQYGLRWLAKTLSRLNSSRDYSGDDLELLLSCPTESNHEDPFRLIKSVGLTEGPLVVSERRTCSSGNCTSSGCQGSSIMEVEFTLTAAQPFLYGSPIPVYDCVPLSLGTLTSLTDPDTPCPPFDCGYQTLVDIGTLGFEECAPPSLPPTATYQNTCFDVLLAELGPTLLLTVPRTKWPELEETVPVFSLTNNSGVYMEGIKLGFFLSDNDNPCGDFTLNPPDCAALCGELMIGPIPPNATFYIDGRTRKMSVICADGSAWAGEKITNGPWSWPTFSDFGFCVAVQFINQSPDPSELIAPDSCVSLSLIPRTF